MVLSLHVGLCLIGYSSYRSIQALKSFAIILLSLLPEYSTRKSCFIFCLNHQRFILFFIFLYYIWEGAGVGVTTTSQSLFVLFTLVYQINQEFINPTLYPQFKWCYIKCMTNIMQRNQISFITLIIR
jgi:hypothetical protein